MDMVFMLGAAAGIMLSAQTAINARLRAYVKTPFLSAMFSCFTSFVLLMILMLTSKGVSLFVRETFSGAAWWMFTGGLLGAFVLVGCIALFPVLGAVQTTVLPIFGQILMGILADAFGLFGYEKKILSAGAAAGIGILIIGIICVVILPDLKEKAAQGSGMSGVSEAAGAPGMPEKRSGGRLGWQIMGILAGMASAAQAAVNGRLGVVTGSSLLASCISVGTVCLVVALINISQRNFSILRELPEEKPPWWALIGGAFGVGIVFLNAYAAPVIGTGMLMVFSVSGQLLCSILIQQFGWLGSAMKKIRPVQGIGLILILVGVVMAKML